MRCNNWTPPRVGVCAAADKAELLSKARALASELSLPAVATDGGDCDLLLVVGADGLELRETGPGAAGAVRVDFGEASEVARRLATASRSQPLARAVGLKKRTPTVLDATAGLGRDALLLATLGCQVIAVERSPILATMLRDALERTVAAQVGGADPRTVAPVFNRRSPQVENLCHSNYAIGPRGGRITLVVGDAVEVLDGMSEEESPDVVYLDPMYPLSGKSALPKKEMRILRRLVGDDPDSAALLEAARRVARNRVVVKRTPHAPPLAAAPTMSISSKLTRYDVYLTGL